MAFMGDDPRGFIISLDLLFAIIPLTIVLGMVSADMGNILYEIEDTVFRSSTDRVAEDTLNTLTQTSGDPYNWEQTGNANIVGLAEYDTSMGKPIPDTLDPNKLASLTNTGVQNIIGNNNTGFYLTVTTLDGTNTTLNPQIGTNPSLNNSIKDIVRVDKIVQCSKLKSVTQLTGQIYYSGQTRIYTVNSFPTSYNFVQNYDYYILFVNKGGNTNSSATVNINNNPIALSNTTIFKGQLINSSFLLTNSSNPNQFLNNSVSLNITTAPFGSSMDFYIVQAPHNTSPDYIIYNNVVPQNCNLTLFIWTK